MEMNEPFHGRVAGDIHDQVDPVVSHEIFNPVGDRNAKVSGAQETGCAGVAI
jgi:hypothetical protein